MPMNAAKKSRIEWKRERSGWIETERTKTQHKTEWKGKCASFIFTAKRHLASHAIYFHLQSNHYGTSLKMTLGRLLFLIGSPCSMFVIFPPSKSSLDRILAHLPRLVDQPKSKHVDPKAALKICFVLCSAARRSPFLHLILIPNTHALAPARLARLLSSLSIRSSWEPRWPRRRRTCWQRIPTSPSSPGGRWGPPGLICTTSSHTVISTL